MMKNSSSNILKHVIACAILFFVLYIFTLSPGVNWGDSAKLVSLSDSMTLHPNAGYHSLRTVLCAPFNYLPVGDLAYRQNISSAFWAVIALGIFFFFCYRLTISISASWIATVSLGLSHTFWHLSVLTESYTVYVCFLVIILLCLLRYTQTKHIKYLYWISFLAGLSIGAHLLIVFSLIPIAIFIFFNLFNGQIKKRHFFIMLGCFFAGFSFLVLVALCNAVDKGWSFSETIYQTMDLTHSHFIKTSFSFSRFFKDIMRRGGLFFYQFQFVGVIIGLWGGWRLLKKDFGLCLIFMGILVCNIAFSLLYQVPKWPYMMLGIYVVFAVFIGYGVRELVLLWSDKKKYLLILAVCALILLPLATYLTIDSVMKNSSLKIARSVPYRNNLIYFLVPWKHNENSAIRFAEGTLQHVKSDDIILSDFTATSVLDYHYSMYPNIKKPIIHDVAFASIDILDYIEQENSSATIYAVGGAPVYKIEKIKALYKTKQTGLFMQILKKRLLKE